MIEVNAIIKAIQRELPKVTDEVTSGVTYVNVKTPKIELSYLVIPETFHPDLLTKKVSQRTRTISETAILDAKAQIIKQSKLSLLSKPNKIEAFVPDLTLPDSELMAIGLQKGPDGWHVPNREWFPNPLNEDSIVIKYGQKPDGTQDIGFCSKEEFSKIYADAEKYNKGIISYIDAGQLPKSQIIKATKCAAGEFCILPEGAAIKTNEGCVRIKPGEAVNINERKNSLFATDIQSGVLDRYVPDPMNPASQKAYKLLDEFNSLRTSMTSKELSIAHAKLYEDFKRIQREIKLFEVYQGSKFAKPPESLRDEYIVKPPVFDPDLVRKF